MRCSRFTVRRTLDGLRATFAALADPYLCERGSDVEAIADRLLPALLGMPELRAGEGAATGSIVVGTELSPLDPIQLKRAEQLVHAKRTFARRGTPRRLAPPSEAEHS